MSNFGEDQNNNKRNNFYINNNYSQSSNGLFSGITFKNNNFGEQNTNVNKDINGRNILMNINNNQNNYSRGWRWKRNRIELS